MILPTNDVPHRIAYLLVAAIAFALLLGGCSKGGDERAVTLRMVAWGNPREEKSISSHLRKFEKAHPGIKVDLWITPHARVFDKLMISTAGGSPPDVSRVSSLWFHPSASKGLFEDLGPYVKRDKSFDLGDFYAQAVEGWGKHNGRLYAIPTDIDVYAMYYNKNMFDKFHLPYPGWSWDWNTYLNTAKALTVVKDGKRTQWGAAPDQFWQTYIYQNGGSVLSSDLSRCTLSEKPAYEAVQWLADLSNKYHVAPSAEESAEIGSLRLFESGKIGMYVSGSWAAELKFKDEIKDFTYDVAPLPKGKARATFIGGAAYAMLGRSQHKNEAWALVKWMTGPEFQRKAAIDSQIIPSRRSVAESGAYLKQLKPPRHRGVFLQMIKYGRADPPVSVSTEMNEMMGAEIQLALLGKKPAKAACEKVAPVIDQLLRHPD